MGGFHLYLFELAFINQFYSRTASLFQQSVANDYFRNHFKISSKYFDMVCSLKWEASSKVRFSYQCSDHLSHSKNFTSLFPLIFLSKHISLYALGRIRWILDIIWPLNQHFKLKNQRNWLNQVWMWKFWNVMNCILLHW